MASAARLGGQREGETRSLKAVVAASFIGTTIEWYDFFLYGTAAALVFGDLFFPEAKPLIGTLLAFSTYAVGFAARPLGGIVFGHFGDRIGRKSMLVMSLLIMGIATILIGCLPTYSSIGILAPILLVCLRFAQGIGVGENGAFYVLTVFTLSYGEDELGLEKDTMLNAVIIAAAIGLITVPLWGALSDRVGRKPLYLAGAVVTTLWAFPLFGLMDTASPFLIALAIVVGVNLGHDLMYGPQGAYFAELFGTRVRYSGASLGYQLASVFA